METLAKQIKVLFRRLSGENQRRLLEAARKLGAAQAAAATGHEGRP